MILRITLTLIIGLCYFPLANAEFVVTIRNISDSQYLNYHRDLIKLALEKTRQEYGDYRIDEISPVETKRTLAMVVQNTYQNFIIELAYDKKLSENKDLTFIDVPVDGGTIGYRVCFVNPAIKAELKTVKSLDELRKYSFAQGVGWADTDILRYNGFKVVEIANFESIFKMTIAGRVDLFCRGANQIKEEMEQFKLLSNITYDDSFVLVYPLPRFFYLNTKSELAKKRIKEGMRLAFDDGSLKNLWYTYNKDTIDFIKLKSRRVFHLENPFVKNLTPEYTRYFFSPIME